MNPQDELDILTDAIKLRAGVIKSPHAAHPLAGEAADSDRHLLKELAAVCGRAKARPGTADSAAFGMGLSTGDFINFMSTAMRSVTWLQLAAHAGHRAFCDLRELRDFKAHVFPNLDMNFNLGDVGELSEIDNDLVLTSQEGLTARLKTYGRNIFISRTLIVNDELELMARLFRAGGTAAARLEAALVYDLIEGNPVLSDGQPMFHADHGNLLPDGLASGLGVAMGMLRSQPTPTGAVADLPAKFLVVGVGLEFTARSMVHGSGLSDITVIASALLPAYRWYLVTDPTLAPVVALLHLKGSATGLLIGGNKKAGDNREGVPLGIRFDVGAVPVGRVGIIRGGA